MIFFYAVMAHNARSWLIALVTLSCAVQVLSDDKAYSQALLKFKGSLTNASMLDDWKKPVDSLCSWDKAVWNGCLCVNGTFVGLKLDGMGLGGRIDVDSLSELPVLSLSVMNNKLAGPFPGGINKLRRLRSLYLEKNVFSGEIGVDAFRGMYALRKVMLGDNIFTGKIPTSLLGLSKLEVLEIQDNQFEGRIPDFWQPNLTVNFSNNHLGGPIPVTLANQSATSFSGNDDLCGKPLKPCKSKQSNHRIVYIVASAVGVALAVFIICFLIYRKRAKPVKRQKPPENLRVKETDKGKRKPYRMNKDGKLYFVRKDGRDFELEELLRASAKVLRSDGFGSSYKAALLSGQTYVVRRFKQMSNVGKEEFFQHMKRLRKLSHHNLLPLVAFYYKKEEKLLITEFVKCGSLADHLHDKRSSNRKSLDWPTRLRIIKGVARGLSYLYKELPTLILPHGHLKSSNVLLDPTYEPLLSEYALAPLINKDQAPQLMAAYKSPESTRLTRKTDVWSLGILILELLTGRYASGDSQQRRGRSANDLATWVNTVVREEWSCEAFDKGMHVRRQSEGAMLRLLKIGMCCCDQNVESRWDLREAVGRIEELKERENGDDEYSSCANEGDMFSSLAVTNDDFSFSRA